MKLEFVEDTNNIRALKEAMFNLTKRPDGLPGLGLLHGKTGRGKTRAAEWYHTQNGGVFIRALANWKPRSMLRDLCAELGHDPEWYTDEVYKQVKAELLAHPQLIFIDEGDYLTTNWRLLETLRDLHDQTGSPFVLIGMIGIRKKLEKYHQFFRRISQMVEFQPLSADETEFIAYDLASLNLHQERSAQIVRVTEGGFGETILMLSHLERMAQANKTPDISRRMVDVIAKAVLKQRAA